MNLRRLFPIVLYICISYVSLAQPILVEKNMVLIEIATGTWCGYCPGAAMAVDQMVEEELSVAVIENHGNDDYDYSGSSSRIGYYGITAFPTARFNGTEEHLGGSGENIYSTYKPIYDKMVSEMTNYALSLDVECTEPNNYKVDVTAHQINLNIEDSVNLYIVLTESHIEESWMGLNEVNFVNRMMVAGDTGIFICFNCSGSYYNSIEFSLDEDWNWENMELVAFLQEKKSKEVLQTNKVELPEFIIENDAQLLAIEPIGNLECENSIVPIIYIQNKGQENLNSITAYYSISNGEESTYNWEGNLATNEIDTVNLSEINVPYKNGISHLNIRLDSPNGEADQVPADNSQRISFKQYVQKEQYLQIHVVADEDGNEISWELLNSTNKVLISGDGYTPGQESDYFIELDNNGCFRLNVRDIGGNGLSGLGSITLFNYESQTAIATVQEFGTDYVVNFKTNFEIQPSLEVRNEYNNILLNGDTINYTGYSKDSLVLIPFSFLNKSPFNSYYYLEIEKIDGNANIGIENYLGSAIFSNNEDSILMNSSIWNGELNMGFRPNNEVGELLVKYTLRHASNINDSISWHVAYASQLTPPIKINFLDSEKNILEKGDTIFVEDYVQNLDSVAIPLYLINKGLNDANLRFKQQVSFSNNANEIGSLLSGSFNSNSGVSESQFALNVGDTIKDLFVVFKAKEPGENIIRFTYYVPNQAEDSTWLVAKFRAKPNPYFELQLSCNNEEIGLGDTLEFTRLVSDTLSIVCELGINNFSNYPVVLKMERSIESGLGYLFDTTFWGANKYVGAHKIFNDYVAIDTANIYSGGKVVLGAPFKEGEYLTYFKVFEQNKEANYVDFYLKYLVNPDTTNLIESSKKHFKVYPNPLKDQLIIEHISDNETYNYAIYSIAGRMLWNKQSAGAYEQINTNDWPAGIYLLHINGGGSFKSLKIVK